MIPAAPPTVSSAKGSKGRIVLTVVGSLGDLHPYIAIALGLQARGHVPVLATSQCYRQKIEALGLGFRSIRPDSAFVADPIRMRRFMGRFGLIWVVQDILFPVLRESYEDTLAAAEGADLLVSHPLTAYVTRLVAEKTGIPWASTMLGPVGFFSIHDLSIFPVASDVLKHLRFLGPMFWGPLFWLGRPATRSLARPLYRLRAEIGLPRTTQANPLVDCHSPSLVLAPFSKSLAEKQSDWPPQTIITGFPFFDDDGAGLPPALAQFLDDGPPPIVFTLGSAVATDARAFFENSVAAAQLLGRRAVLVLKDHGKRLPSLPAGVVAFDYAPFSLLFPRAAVTVHHGGIGTTGLAIWSERPMLVMPCAWDQPDNADRVARLGIARTISRHRYTPARVAALLRQLLDNPAFSERAAAVGKQVREEDGVRAACDALEPLLQTTPLRSGN